MNKVKISYSYKVRDKTIPSSYTIILRDDPAVFVKEVDRAIESALSFMQKPDFKMTLSTHG